MTGDFLTTLKMANFSENDVLATVNSRIINGVEASISNYPWLGS